MDVRGAATDPPRWQADVSRENGGRNWAPGDPRDRERLPAYLANDRQRERSIGVAKAPADRTSTGQAARRESARRHRRDAAHGRRRSSSPSDRRQLQGKLTPILVKFADGLPAAGSVQPIREPGRKWRRRSRGAVDREARRSASPNFTGHAYDERLPYRRPARRLLTGAWEKKGAPVPQFNDAWVGSGHGRWVQSPAPTARRRPLVHRFNPQVCGEHDPVGLVPVDRIEWAETAGRRSVADRRRHAAVAWRVPSDGSSRRRRDVPDREETTREWIFRARIR